MPKGIGGTVRAQENRASLWPGITTGYDARCTCTWAWNGRAGEVPYEIKLRDAGCVTHGGDLAAVLRRQAREAR